MDQKQVLERLSKHLSGEINTDDLLEFVMSMPMISMKDAIIDTHRKLRTNVPEVIFCLEKTAEQINSIAESLYTSAVHGVLLTKLDQTKIESLETYFSNYKLKVDYIGKCAFLEKLEIKETGKGKVLIICAGTSDLPIARECFFSLKYLGNTAELLVDLGVAGIHRLYEHLAVIREASIIIVIAGMEGALASIIGGLTKAPIIGVPTSVGYGASFGGVAALLSMLNSCSPGTAVVNIDNGFGAAAIAHKINHI